MLRVCLIVVAFAVCLLLGFCGWLSYDAPRSKLPPELEWSEILAYHEDGGLREACIYGLYRLTPESAADLSRSGPWEGAPMVLDSSGKRADNSLYALNANSCAPDGPWKSPAGSVSRALQQRGTVYRTFNHNEGLIVVEPKTRLTWYLYYG